MTYIPNHYDPRPYRSRLIPVSALLIYFAATAMLALLFGQEVAALFAIVAVAVTWVAVRLR